MTLVDLIARLDRADVGIDTLDPKGAMTWAEVGALARGNARRWAGQGITRGDRVVLAMDNDLEHVVAFLSLMALGAIPVSVKPRRGPEAAYAQQLAQLAARYGIRSAYRTLPPIAGTRAIAWDPEARDASAPVASAAGSDIAFVQFSSGSLGAPKAVPIRHASLMDNIRAITEIDRRRPDSLGYCFLPLSHDMGLVGVLSCLLHQNHTCVSSPRHFLRYPVAYFDKYGRCDVVAMPDFALRYLARHLALRGHGYRRDLLAHIGTIYCGAEPIRYSTIAQLIDAAAPLGFDPRALVFCYGMAECTLIATAHRFESLDASFTDVGHDRKLARVGSPIAGIDMRVDGDEGAIHLRGASVFSGYLDDAPLADGWHDSGDIGFLRDGVLHISGRAKDMIIINGENIFPADIEGFVSRLDGIVDNVVLTEDDGFYLFIVPSVNVDPVRVAAQVAVQFGAAPLGIATGRAQDILRTTSGKPMRQAMLEELRKASAFADPKPPVRA
jgi:acyl-CoA synthetase (AMP-forming)/AMP-acid ligase II